MSTEYRIEPAGPAYIVIEPWGEQLVHTYPTEDAARRDIERCKKEDAMWETAKLLVDTAIKTHMHMHDVDRETASYWINSALGGA
jgi:S-adenosylmethionine/arginine decarboxylase-like enzyme